MNWLDLLGTVFMLGVVGAALFVVATVVVYVLRTGRAGRDRFKRLSESRRFITAEGSDGRPLRYRINVPGRQVLTGDAYDSLYRHLRTTTAQKAAKHLVYRNGAWHDAA
jgi:hypothetical protein